MATKVPLASLDEAARRGQAGHDAPPTPTRLLRLQYAIFGLAEPAVNVATTILITSDSTLFVRMLFARAARTVEHASDVVPTLCRMYASVLLCFGLTQAFLWHGWRWAPSSAGTQRSARLWMWLMLAPDFHHLVVAYGPYLVGPHGQLDAALVAHYAVQGVLTLCRLAFLLFFRSEG